MKFFDILFSKNKRKWISFLNEVSSPMDRYIVSKWRLIVDNFFLKYNIDYDKYIQHVRWDNGRLSIYQDTKEKYKCSPSFRMYYVDNVDRKLSNLNLGVNEWFYHGFPDVAKYFEENYEQIESYCNLLGYHFSPEDSKYNLHVFEYVVEEYLKKYKKIECSIG